jgi:hypothetical protein
MGVNMKKLQSLLLLIITVVSVSTASAYAYGYGRFHGGWGGPRFGVGINLGPYPYYGPGYPGYAYPYYGPTVVPVNPAPIIVQEQVPTYIQPAQAANNWYFCQSTNTYYPYVKECAEGWKTVPSQPQAPRPN